MNLRRAAHDWSLLFCGAVAVYLISAVVAARLGVWLAAAIHSSPSATARVLLGVLALDLSKAIGLTLVALLLAVVVKLGALATALGLVLLTYALDVVVSLLLQQGGWLVLAPAVLACRVAAVALLVALVHLVVRRRRRAAPA